MEVTQEAAQLPTLIRVTLLLEALAALHDRAPARAALWELVQGEGLLRRHAKLHGLAIKLQGLPGLRGWRGLLRHMQPRLVWNNRAA